MLRIPTNEGFGAYLVNIYQLMISEADCFTVDIQEHDLERLGREVTILQQN